MEPSRVQLDATTRPDGRAIVGLVGELDVADAQPVRRILTAEAVSATFVVVDLAGLSFIDVAGVRALDAAQHDARQCGSRLFLVSPPRCVSRLVALMGFGHMRFTDDRSVLQERSRPVASISARSRRAGASRRRGGAHGADAAAAP